MIYWEILAGDNFTGLYFNDQKLAISLAANGIDINTARLFFLENDLVFSVISDDFNSILTEDGDIGDILSYNWIRVFSKRAKNFIKSIGYSDEDFFKCKMDINSGQIYYLFLPLHSYNLIDYDKSKFAHYIPVSDKKSQPFHLTKLVLNSDDAPMCFFANAPFGKQIIPELIVSDEFKKMWEEKKLKGERFRKI